MIASWMFYAVAVGALLTVAALGLDRVAIARRRPTRFVWFTALSLSITLPIARAAARLAPEPTAAGASHPVHDHRAIAGAWLRAPACGTARTSTARS